MLIVLNELADTLRLGRVLAATFARRERPPALLLFGGLGAGKTTLVRALVESLPGAEQAEVTSPSFNIVNLYPTTPPVAHFDLYRLENGRMDDEIFEILESGRTWNVVEWADRLSPADVPNNPVHIVLQTHGTGRTAQIQANRADEEILSKALAGKQG